MVFLPTPLENNMFLQLDHLPPVFREGGLKEKQLWKHRLAKLEWFGVIQLQHF